MIVDNWTMGPWGHGLIRKKIIKKKIFCNYLKAYYGSMGPWVNEKIVKHGQRNKNKKDPDILGSSWGHGSMGR